ncbi:hypothetical protein [Plebeiibacterium sediminum]|uniref:Bacterial surface antigen (D15) domain-containing protein n=1 Tax=Plebeiibacterium sediminum TaxID=2992112 RepID=A0AAE3M812_9BACT|nr:hypothetical protein [Plebeiobacterium sediminum]MCW3788707.1 hypothetical protein [Plebeiobacterium sediminum]
MGNIITYILQQVKKDIFKKLLWVALFFCFHVFVVSAQKQSNDSIKITNSSIQQLLKANKDSSYIYNKLYEWLVVSKDSNISANELLLSIEHEYQKYNHKIIRSINIKQISPFARNILDTIDFTTNKLEKTLTKLRFQTKQSIIKNSLTFKNGELLNIQDVNESERMLRSLNFITNALIVVEPANKDTSLVDVLVITQDSYPYGANVSLSTKHSTFGVYSRNVFGYGLEMNHSIDTRATENNSFGFDENIQWDNIYGSFISFSTEINNTRNDHFINMGLNKDFFIPEIKYAGGINIKRNYRVPADSIADDNEYNNFDYLNQDYWLGRTFLINAPNYFNRSTVGILGQVIINNYFNLPDSIKYDSYYLPNYYFFTGISFNKRSYYKNTLIYNYGRIEDVPYGFLSSMTFGYNYNEKKNRYYLGGHLSLGSAIVPNNGYIYLSADFNSFFYNSHPERTLMRYNSRYISSLKKIGNSQFRYFVSLYYTRAMHLDHPQYFYLTQNSPGISSYRSRDLRGLQKFVLNSESVLFTPTEILGFKVVPFSFADIGWISEDKILFGTKPYYSIGVGIRIRNDNLVFNTIQFQLAYFPRIPMGGTTFDFRLSGEDVGGFRSFDIQKPYSDRFE